jgi:Zn-dependent peptidase ImmA (M78 family)/transcriptional regulator with XRE-family HTH domain
MDLSVGVATRVRDVIRESGLNQGEFAVKAGLDTSKMSKSLSGVRRFTSLDLANIAEVAGVTVDWLLHGHDASRAMAARAVEDDGAGVSQAIEKATIFAQARADLSALTGNSPDWLDIHLDVTGRLIDQGDKLAKQALAAIESLGRASTELCLATLIEFVFKIDVAIVDVVGGCDGLAWRDANARLILVATSSTPTRQRFTLAHELGHLLAGDDQDLHVDRRIMGPAQRGVASEIRANAFAASFLMPEGLLRAAHMREVGSSVGLADAAFSRLVMEFAVSPSAMGYRLENLSLISRDERQRLMTLRGRDCASIANQAERMAEWIQVSQRFRPPMALVRDSLIAYFAGKTTLRPVANLLQWDVDQLQDAMDATDQSPAAPERSTDAPDSTMPAGDSELVFAP